MGIDQQLLELELAFWNAAGDRGAYEASLAADAVHLFPGVGMLEREAVLEAVAGAEPWAEFTIGAPELVTLGGEGAALVYTAHAVRAGQPPYVAAITSVYRRRGEGWELVLHQQTPLPDA